MPLNTTPRHKMYLGNDGRNKNSGRNEAPESPTQTKGTKAFPLRNVLKKSEASGFKWAQCSKGKRSDLKAAFVELPAGENRHRNMQVRQKS